MHMMPSAAPARSGCYSLLGASHKSLCPHCRGGHDRVHHTHNTAYQAGPCSLPGVSQLSALAMPEVQSSQDGPYA